RLALERQEIVVAAARAGIAAAGGGPRLVDRAATLLGIEEAANPAEVHVLLAAHGILMTPALAGELGSGHLEAKGKVLGQPLDVALGQGNQGVGAAVAGALLAVVHFF